MSDLPTLYRQHLQTLDGYLADALERCWNRGLELDGVVLHAGRTAAYHGDDEEIVFHATPHFRRWIPLEGPEHVAVALPGEPLRVVRVQPRDYWRDTSAPPPSFWEEEVRLEVVESFGELSEELRQLGAVAYVGNSREAAAELGIPEELIEPAALLAPLDWYRAYKTGYEVSQIRQAAERAAGGHRAALQAFLADAGERQIHWAYLEGSGHLERELPFDTIVALDAKSAILHYQHKRGPKAGPGEVLLVDAGAASRGYAADVTRTWARESTEPIFRHLLAGLDRIERQLVALVTPGRSYVDIHLQTHRLLAELLAESGVVTGSPNEVFDRGLTRTFLPHGVGHHLGLQVHDVGGWQAGPEGGEVPPPDSDPWLRNTRTVEPGHVVTIEPGLYFIPMLLEDLRAIPEGSLVDWEVVGRLLPCGGIRIEDDVLCTEGEPEDLTRPLIPGPNGS